MNILATLFLFISFAHFEAAAETLKEYLAFPPNPMKIHVTLGSEKTTKKIVASVGGTLVLTAENGDVFELNLPPNSLQRDTEITMQKVSSVQHSNLSTTANYSSVEISPDGAELLKPAILTFKPKKSFPINKLTPFSAHADGNETHLAMLVGTPVSNEIQIGLLHFSNYTISDDPTVDEIIDRGFAQMENTRIANWMNQKILISKRTNGSIWADVDQAFREGFDNVLLPSILSANSCDSGQEALRSFLVWTRQAELLGMKPEAYYPKGFEAKFDKMFQTTSDRCFELVKKACYVDHQPAAVWTYSLGVMKSAELLGDSATASKFSDFAMKCSKFKFFMASEIWAGETRDDSSGLTAKAEFDFILTPFTEGLIEGSIDIESSYLNITDFVCTETFFQTKPSKVYISNFLLEDRRTNPTNYTIAIGGLTPYSLSKFQCVNKEDQFTVDLSVPAAPMGSYWGGMFLGTHGPTGLNEYDTNTGFYHIKGWQVRNDTRFAVKEYSQTVEGSLNETTTIIIYHTPEAL